MVGENAVFGNEDWSGTVVAAACWEDGVAFCETDVCGYGGVEPEGYTVERVYVSFLSI